MAVPVSAAPVDRFVADYDGVAVKASRRASVPLDAGVRRLGPMQVIGATSHPLYAPLVAALSAAGAHSPNVEGALILVDPERAEADRLWDMLALARNARAGGTKQIIMVGAGADGLPGLARTAAREWTDVRVAYVNAQTIEGLLTALQSGHDDIEVDATGAGWGPVLTAPVMAGAARRVASTWIVTGGARGVTADCVVELAAQTGGRFALIGRSVETPWPVGIADTDDLKRLRGQLAGAAKQRGETVNLRQINQQARAAMAGRDIRQTLHRIQSVGGQAIYVSQDLSSATGAHSAVIAAQQALGPIGGVIHGAGVLADRLIMDKTREEFDRVFATKVTALDGLLGALDLSRLTDVALFSSAAARFGNSGQADYAMANERLNAAARSLFALYPHLHVKSFNWGPWDGGMVDDTLASHFREAGIGLIPVAVGARIFADQMLRGARQDVEILVGDEWTSS